MQNAARPRDVQGFDAVRSQNPHRGKIGVLQHGGYEQCLGRLPVAVIQQDLHGFHFNAAHDGRYVGNIVAVMQHRRDGLFLLLPVQLLPAAVKRG